MQMQAIIMIVPGIAHLVTLLNDFKVQARFSHPASHGQASGPSTNDEVLYSIHRVNILIAASSSSHMKAELRNRKSKPRLD